MTTRLRVKKKTFSDNVCTLFFSRSEGKTIQLFPVVLELKGEGFFTAATRVAGVVSHGLQPIKAENRRLHQHDINIKSRK